MRCYAGQVPSDRPQEFIDMFNLPAKLVCAVMILFSYSPTAADETVLAKGSIVDSISTAPGGPLAEPTLVQHADRSKNQRDDKALKRLDELRLKHLNEQLREANEQAFVWFQAYKYERENQQRQDVLLGLWRRYAEASLTVTAFENSVIELDPRIFTGDTTGDVEPMPFGTGSFGPWSTGLIPPRP